MTIRDLIRAMQLEIGTGDLLPDRAAELLMKAAALMGNVADEIRQADVAFAHVLLKELEANEHYANRAKIRAETSPEYLRKREARDTKELLVEMSRSLLHIVGAWSEIRRASRHYPTSV